jgi:hypothetical protein
MQNEDLSTVESGWSSACRVFAMGSVDVPPLQRRLALSAGFGDYVKTPFAPQDLVRTVAGLVRGVERDSDDPIALFAAAEGEG